METTKVNLNSITKNTFILKPNFHMNFGKRRIEQARKNEADAQLRAAVALERVAGFERNLPLSQ